MDKPDLYVIARCLDILYWRQTPIKKTNLQMLSGLNYPRFIEYLDWMISHGLLIKVVNENGNEEVKLTKKGMDAYQRLVEWIKETMQGIKI